MTAVENNPEPGPLEAELAAQAQEIQNAVTIVLEGLHSPFRCNILVCGTVGKCHPVEPDSHNLPCAHSQWCFVEQHRHWTHRIDQLFQIVVG